MSSASVQVVEEPVAAFTGRADTPAAAPEPSNDPGEPTLALAFRRLSAVGDRSAWPPTPPIDIMVGSVRMILSPRALSPTERRLELAHRVWASHEAGREGAVVLYARKLERMVWPATVDPHRIWPDRDALEAVLADHRETLSTLDRTVPLRQSGVDPALYRPTEQASSERYRQVLSNPLSTEKQRDAAVKGLKHIEDCRLGRLSDAWADAANDETATLAEARGETVERKKGRVRIVSRCGLNQALMAGYLRPGHGAMSEQDTWDAARKYRDAFEVTNGCTTPSANDQGGGGAVRAPEVRLALAGQLLAVMRKGLAREAVVVLDTVCGETRSVAVAAKRIHRRFEATHAVLTQAITQVVINLAEERRLARAGLSELRTGEEIGDAVDAVDRVARAV